MIQIKTLEVAGIGPAIHAMRNPYDSWEKSDTHRGKIGDKDKELSEKLGNAGPCECVWFGLKLRKLRFIGGRNSTRIGWALKSSPALRCTQL